MTVTDKNRQSFLLRLLAATALTTCVSGGILACTIMPAAAQVVIGGEKEKADVQVFQAVESPFGQDGWPYNVKRTKSSWAHIDAEADKKTLPTRQVSPALLAAAQGNAPAMPQAVAPSTLKPPTISSTQSDQPRDVNTTLPPVTTGTLMANMAGDRTADTVDVPAATSLGSDTQIADTAPSLTLSAPSNDDAAAILSGRTSARPSTTALASASSDDVVAAPAPTHSSGRALFGGRGSKSSSTRSENIQVAQNTTKTLRAPEPEPMPEPAPVVDNTPVDVPVAAPAEEPAMAAPVAAPVAAEEHTLQAPAAAPVTAVDKPSVVARKSSSGGVASLTGLSKAPPRLLGHMGDTAPAVPVANVDEAPVIPPAEPEPVPAPAPEKQPVVAVLPSKAEEKNVAITPTPQSSDNGDDGDGDGDKDHHDEAVATPVVEKAKPADDKPGFFGRLFGSSKTSTKEVAAKPATSPVVEPTPMVPDPVPAAAPVAEVAPAPVAEPAPVVEPASIVAAAPVPVAAPAPTALEAPAKPDNGQHGLWTDLFGSSKKAKTAPAAAPAPEPVPVIEPTPVVASAAVVEPVPTLAPEPVRVEPKPAPKPEPKPAPVMKAPEPVVEMPKPVPAPVVEPEPVAVAPAPVAAPEPEPAPVATPAADFNEEPNPAAPPVAKPGQRSLWSSLFGDDDKPTHKKSAPVTEPAPEPVAEPVAAPVAVVEPTPVAPPPPVVEPVKVPEPKPEPVRMPEPVRVEPKPAPEPAYVPPPPPAPVVEEPVIVAPVAVAEPEPVVVAQRPEPAAAPVPVDEEPNPAAPPKATSKPSRGFWSGLFGSDDSKPAKVEAAPVAETEAAPVDLSPEPNPAAPAIRTAAAPIYAPAVPSAPQRTAYTEVPTFRVEAPATEGKLVTPRLVPVTAANAVRPAVVATPPAPVVAAPVPAAPAAYAAVPMAQIGFLPASVTVDAIGQAQLQAIAEAMNASPQAQLTLNAYAVTSGSGEARRISLNRALAVRSKLAELGIQPARIFVRALGDDLPSGIKGGHDRVDAILQ